MSIFFLHKFSALYLYWSMACWRQRVGGLWDGYWLTESLLHDGDAFAGGLAYWTCNAATILWTPANEYCPVVKAEIVCLNLRICT